MAILSNQSFLMRKKNGESSFTKLVDVTNIPTLLGVPENIDVTTLSHTKYVYIQGLQTSESLEFNAWYDKEKYEELNTIMQEDKAKTGTSQLDTYRVCLGTTEGVQGIFEWQGKLTVSVTSFGVNEAVPMTIVISDEGDEELHYVAGTP